VGFNAIGETPRAEPGVPGALSVRMPPRTGPLVPADLDHVASVVRRAARRADVVVALPHWGTQYTHTPEPIQRTVARRLVAAGADLVVGGHPHWVQAAEEIGDVPVLHSLGNFVFDMDFMTETMEGVFLETTWRGDELVRTRLVPYRMDPVAFAPRVVRGAAAEEILGDVRAPAPAP
jgi:poly-gamma-glutamate capsule biosynthesis protein CapA/YwtB (metallophosphatase superfamily)